MTEYRYSNCRCCKPTIITDCCPEGLARQLTLNYESTCECIGTGSVTMTYVLTPIDPTIIAVTGWTGAGWEVDIDFSDCDNNNGSHLYMYFYCEDGVRKLGGVFYAYDETEVLESAGIIGTEDACFSWGHSGGNPSITAPPMWNGTSYVCDDSSPGHQMAFAIEGPGVSKCCPDECCPFGLGEVLTLAYNTTCECIGPTGTINLIFTTAASCPVVTRSAPQSTGWEGTLDLADCDNNNGAKIYFFYYCYCTGGDRRLYIAMQAETEAAGTNVVSSINIEDDCFSYGHDVEGNPAITLINVWNGTGYVCPEAPLLSATITGTGVTECCAIDKCGCEDISRNLTLQIKSNTCPCLDDLFITLSYTTSTSNPIPPTMLDSTTPPSTVGWEALVDLNDCDNDNGSRVYFLLYCDIETDSWHLFSCFETATETGPPTWYLYIQNTTANLDECLSFGTEGNGYSISCGSFWNGTEYGCGQPIEADDSGYFEAYITGPGINECCSVSKCGCDNIPSTLTLTFTPISGCECATAGIVTLTYDPDMYDDGAWVGTSDENLVCGHTITCIVYCVPALTEWDLDITINGCTGISTLPDTEFTCEPFTANWQLSSNLVDCGCDAVFPVLSVFDISVTE